MAYCNKSFCRRSTEFYFYFVNVFIVIVSFIEYITVNRLWLFVSFLRILVFLYPLYAFSNLNFRFFS